MSQSLSNVLLHVIFSTKNREPFFENEILRKEVACVSCRIPCGASNAPP